MLGGGWGPGACSPENVFKKNVQFGAFKGPFKPLKFCCFLGVFLFVFFFNVAFEDKSENKEKEEP